ncbi:MAG: GntR family transcriptional regulator [Propionibacteriaceae bacterium]|jgi:hypothetical protein|nr:GntR family transcriptional regulator [Propionibacteriaceae bacterium]
MTYLPTAPSAREHAVRNLALRILRTGPGQTLPPILELQSELGVGSGTLQQALRQLTSLGGVELRTHGHQGTVIEAWDQGVLWRQAALDPLRLVSTPPGSVEVSATAISLRSQLAEYGLHVEFDFVRGGTARAVRLRGDERCAIHLSRGAAISLGLMDSPEYACLELGPLTYYRPDTLVILETPEYDTSRPRRIAIDPDSYDLMRLTEVNFPVTEGYEYVECRFPDVAVAMLTGKIDAGVWHKVVTAIPPRLAGLNEVPISQQAMSDWFDELSSGVLVWRSAYAEVGAILSLVDPGKIQAFQDELAAQGIESSEVRAALPWL